MRDPIHDDPLRELNARMDAAFAMVSGFIAEATAKVEINDDESVDDACDLILQALGGAKILAVIAPDAVVSDQVITVITEMLAMVTQKIEDENA